MDVWAPDYEPNNKRLGLGIIIGLALVAVAVIVVWGLA